MIDSAVIDSAVIDSAAPDQAEAPSRPLATPSHGGHVQYPLHPGIVRDVAVSVILLWGSVLATMAIVTEQHIASKAAPLRPPAAPNAVSSDQAAPAPVPHHSTPPDGAGAQAAPPRHEPPAPVPVPDGTTDDRQSTNGCRDGHTGMFDTGGP